MKRFAFVVHPLSVAHIHQHRGWGWTRLLPDRLVESMAARISPRYLGRLTGAVSAATGQRIEGLIYTLGATPRQMLERRAEFTDEKIARAARQAAKQGARILGLGAYTRVVGDGGMSVARHSPIPVTSGRSLTVVATLESVKQALRRTGHSDLSKVRAMVVGATGSVGAIISRLLAQTLGEVDLISLEPDRLKALATTIRGETENARLTVGYSPEATLADCDLVILAAPASAGQLIDLTRTRPGAVICDLGLPCRFTAEQAEARPDLLLVESADVVLPGSVELDYDIGLPPGVVYACLAEPALLAMQGLIERNAPSTDFWIDRVRTLKRLFVRHGLAVAPLRSFGKIVTAAALAEKLAHTLRLRERAARLDWSRANAAGSFERLSA